MDPRRRRNTTAALAATAVILAAAAGTAGAVNVTISAPCVAAAAAFAANATAGCPALGGVLGSPADTGACVAPSGSLAPLAACRLPGTLFNASGSGGDAAVPACPLCGPQLPACQVALDALVAAALGSDATPGGGAVAAGCGGLPSDVLTLTLLREQSRLTCAAAGGVAPPTRLPGRMSLASLTQCSSCGVVACPPGLFCPGGTAPPEICPAGYYCPGGFAKVVCPAGSYCPDRSAEPTQCRSIASCPQGSTREVVWVPLLVCLLLLVGLAVGLRAARTALTTPRPVGKAAVAAPGTAAPAAASVGGGSLPRIAVSFTDLRLTTRGNVRMDGVSGAVAPGRLTAIMGGSGAGKTTLSNLLLNKETPSGGSVTVAVAPPADDPAAFAPYTTTVGALRGGVGFVPQVDVMDRRLTVRQLLTHAAFTRLPGAWSATRKAAHVDATLRHMGLTHVADAVVGDAGGEGGSSAVGGLSGGEVKATNIAIELAANPGLLVLDEPTTGAWWGWGGGERGEV
jgi:ABC-type cobalamin/Fe3+-siderophores transport system ATPase subunit